MDMESGFLLRGKGKKNAMSMSSDDDDWDPDPDIPESNPHEGLPGVLLSGQRVQLRPVGIRDYPVLFRWATNHMEAHYWRERRELPSVEAFGIERQEALAHELSSMLVQWRHSGAPIGWISAHDYVARTRRCALTVYFTPAARAFRGTDEALALFLDVLILVFSLDKVTIDIVKNNEATQLLVERLGFVEEGRTIQQWMYDDRDVEVVRYGLPRATWRLPRTGLSR